MLDIFGSKVVRNRAMIDLREKVVMIAGANGVLAVTSLKCSLNAEQQPH